MDNLNLPNKVHSSLDGNIGNLHADLYPTKKYIFFKPTNKTIYVDNIKIDENEYNISVRCIIREINI